MQGAAGDPKELFLSQSLNSCCNIIQRGFFFWGGGGAEGALGHLWLWSVYPYKMLLVRVSVFWGEGWPFCPLWVQPLAQHRPAPYFGVVVSPVVGPVTSEW